MSEKIRHRLTPLRALRLRANLTLREAGALIDRSHQTVWQWEIGEKVAPPADLRRYQRELKKRARAG